jgi:hypothetical protein
MRSRSGLEIALQAGLFADARVVESALMAAPLSITQAYLLPFAPATTGFPKAIPPIEPVILKKLGDVVPASPMHLTLVEDRQAAVSNGRPGRGPG